MRIRLAQKFQTLVQKNDFDSIFTDVESEDFLFAEQAGDLSAG